jgi:hypothetical protein
LRISLDAKATIPLGEFSRGGKSRVVVKAQDHDFQPEEKVTPFGLFLPDFKELFLYLTTSKVTSDFIVDCLADFWKEQQFRFPSINKLLVNLDNGPENHSRRTQFMHRLVQFVDETEIEIELCYYPPYHSKYNPIERVWGVLEQHWNGSLLDSLDAVLGFAKTMTYQGLSPCVKLVDKIYESGKKLSQKAMARLEQRFERLPSLKKWFVNIPAFA